MTCQIQNKTPVQLYVALPSDGCTSDLKVDGGEQRSVFSCDWDVKTKTHDCRGSYYGVAWHRADANHLEINLPETPNMTDENFRYQISCHDDLQSGPCLTSPDNIVEATSKIFDNTTMTDNSKEKSELSSEAIIATAVACGIAILILVLILTFFVRRNRRLKRSTKREKQETASKKIDVSTSILLKRVRDDNTTDVDP